MKVWVVINSWQNDFCSGADCTVHETFDRAKQEFDARVKPLRQYGFRPIDKNTTEFSYWRNGDKGEVSIREKEVYK